MPKQQTPQLATVRVAAAQMISRNGNTPANITKALQWCDRAAARNVQILCFPEAASTGFDWIKDKRRFAKLHCEPVPGPMVKHFEKKAAATNMYIIMGMIEQPRHSSKRYNTAFLVGPTEGYMGKYRKILAERVFAPGREVPVFETAHGRLGIFICADKRSPEIARLLTLRGAQMFFQPTNYSHSFKNTSSYEIRKKYQGKFSAQRSRAMENGLPLIAANAGRSEYVNNSFIIEPNSQGPPHFLARATRKEQLLVADIEIDTHRDLATAFKKRMGWLFKEIGRA